MSKLAASGLWKVFGRQPARALKALQQGEPLPAGHVAAVRNVSFEVEPGEIFVVMGLSGSGKSTLLRCLARLIEPTAGSVHVNGKDVLALDARGLRDLRRNTLSMVFQHFGLLPHRKVLDNVAFGLEVRGADKAGRIARAQAMIDLVGLKGWEQHRPNQLSGGMQQRVGLARALAVDPEILLFDEPFSALDPLIRSELQDELLRLQAQLKKTAIFITHDFGEALKIGDRVAIMKDGAFVQVGKPAELVLNPVDGYVRAFVKDAPRIKVLNAAAVMRSGAAATGAQRVQTFTPLEQLLPMIADSDNPLAVCNGDGGVVGVVDRASVIQALIQR